MTDSNIYYNVLINYLNSSEKSALGFPIASFKETRVDAILKNPSEYELAIERFKVPTFSIPILFFKSNYYYVRMSYNGDTITQPLVYVPNGGEPLYGNVIYNYQDFIDILNNALSSCFTILKGVQPGAPPTERPFVVYDATTQLCSFYAEQLYDINGPPTIKVEMSNSLYHLFPSWQTISQADFEWYQIVIKNNKNNSTVYNAKNYYIMTQEYSTLALWNDLQSVIFYTDSIPINQELEPSQANKTRRIVTDFEPLDDVNIRDSLQFFPQGPLRFYDLKSDYPLNTIDIKVRFQTKDGQIYPCYVFPDNQISLKILFRKKQVFNDEGDY